MAQPFAQGGSSRIHLAHILRDGAIWQVFIATAAGHGETAAVLLEFERSGGGDEPNSYATPLRGRLRDALYGGGSVARADLVHELDLAIRTDVSRLDETAAAGSKE